MSELTWKKPLRRSIQVYKILLRLSVSLCQCRTPPSYPLDLFRESRPFYSKSAPHHAGLGPNLYRYGGRRRLTQECPFSTLSFSTHGERATGSVVVGGGTRFNFFWGKGRVVAFLGVRPWNSFPFEEEGPVILSVDSQKKLMGG